jgi:hypothetical protein
MNLRSFFERTNSSPNAPYKTYVIKADNNPDKIQKLTKWMDTHSIRYGHPSAGKATKGFDYQTQTAASFNLTTDDIVVNIFQPKSRFITTVFEPQSKLPDSLTYDITAWNLMYSYNLKAYALNETNQCWQAFPVKGNRQRTSYRQTILLHI